MYDEVQGAGVVPFKRQAWSALCPSPRSFDKGDDGAFADE